MYLSRLILNPRNRRVQKEVADRYQLHRTLMTSFEDDLGRGEERVLFRLDESHRGQELTMLVQSWTMPDWSWLAASGARGYLLPVSQRNPAMKSFHLDLRRGQRLAFRLRANPTARRRCSDGERRRVALYDDSEQMDWLERKAQQGGFALVSVRSGGQTTVGGSVYRSGTKHELTLLSIQFDGVLDVRDPHRLRDAVRQGIGSGKAFGFGLLSLAASRAS